MSTRNVPPWYGVSDGPVFKSYVMKQQLVRLQSEYVYETRGKKGPLSPPRALGKMCIIEQKKRAQKRAVVPVMVPRMCANESPTSSTDTPEALSEAISRSSFDKRLVSM